uniref:Uncharacterized protein n=1 Tax=Arundo donax TaxID=35708 RepID=A0A0A9AMI4_ARUDO
MNNKSTTVITVLRTTASTSTSTILF